MPTGTVTFEVARKVKRKVTEEVLGMAAVMGGEAMLTVKPGLVLNRAITVVYSGDTNDMPSMLTPPELTRHALERLAPSMARELGRPSLRYPGPTRTFRTTPDRLVAPIRFHHGQADPD